MKKQGEKIPTIRKQYVQTIFDGLKTQFDETTKQQLLDQIERVDTLQSVYEQSFKAQSSIVQFLAKMCKDRQISQHPLFSEFSQQLEELEKQNSIQRKSIIIQNLSGKVGEASETINLLIASLDELKCENLLLTQQVQKLHEEKQTQKKLYQDKIANLLLMEEKYKALIEEKEKKFEQVKKSNLEEQNIMKKLLQEQNEQKLKYIQEKSENQRLKLLEQIKKYQESAIVINKKNNELSAQVLSLSGQNDELKVFIKQSENLVKSLEEQLEIILKFSNYEQKKTLKIKKKISDRQLINKDQLQKLAQFSERQNQKAENLKQLQQCFDSILPVSCQKNLMLERITQNEQEHYSSNSIVSQRSRNKEEKQQSKTEQQIKQELTSTLNKSETTGKLLTNRQEDRQYIAIRQCQSRTDSNSNLDGDDVKTIQQEITELKEELEKKISVMEQSFEEDNEPNSVNEESAIPKQSEYLKIHKRQSKRTSEIIAKLQQSHITTNIYYQKLEQQNEIINKRLSMQKAHFKDQIDEHNDRIDELMNKIQELEQQRIRGLNSLQNYEASLFEKNHEVDILCNEVEKLREENNQFADMCQKSKADLQGQKRKVQNLEDQIRQLNTQKEKISQQKSRMEEQMSYQAQIKSDLQGTVQKKQQQLASKAIQNQKLIKNLNTVSQKLSESQQIIIQLEGTALQYQKCIDELENKIELKNEQERSYLDQIERLKKLISELTEKFCLIEKNLKEKQDELDRALHGIKIMQKNNEDLKYMNAILKKDVMKIRQIQAYDWEKQCEQAPTNLKGTKILKVSNMKDQPENLTRSKNSSYTGPATNTISPQQFKNSQVPLKVLSKDNPSHNFPVSKLNFTKQPKLNYKFDLDLDLNQGNNYSKTYKQNRYLTERSERPLTDIIKKKYML